MLSHFSAGFTLDTYAHITASEQKEAAHTMGNALSKFGFAADRKARDEHTSSLASLSNFSPALSSLEPRNQTEESEVL